MGREVKSHQRGRRLHCKVRLNRPTRGGQKVVEGIAVDDLHSSLTVPQPLFAEAWWLVRIHAKHEPRQAHVSGDYLKPRVLVATGILGMPTLIDFNLNVAVFEDEYHIRTFKATAARDSTVPHELVRLARQLRQSAVDFGKDVVLPADLEASLVGLHRDEAAPADRYVTSTVTRRWRCIVDGASR